MKTIKNENGQDFDFTENIPYREESFYKNGPANVERCKLDLTIPQNKQGFSTVIWFHGGGLTGGAKHTPMALTMDAEHPSAVVCMDDAQAIALCQTLSQLGLRVPEDVSLISFNNTEIGRYHQPALTTLDVHPYQLGVHAMRLMLDVLAGKAEAPAAIDVPFTLIPRDSVANLTTGSESNA